MRTWARRTTGLAVIGATVSLSLAACGGSGVARSNPMPAAGVRRAGGPSGPIALQQATRSMQAAAGYVFSGVVGVGPSQVSVSGEFQAPDRIHEVITSPGRARAEVLVVGGDTFVRSPTTRRWHRSPTGSGVTDPRTAFAALLQATDVRLSGGRYDFDLPPAAAGRLLTAGTPAAGASGSATVMDDTISTLQISLSTGATPVKVSLRYSSVGNAPPVTAPGAG